MNKKLFWLLASILIIPLVAGCGSTSTTNGKLSTPRKTWVAFVSAMDAGNAQAFYALLSSSAKAGAGGSAGDASTLMSRWKSSLFAPESFSKATIAGINENDGQATIKFTFPGQAGYSGSVIMVNEGGKWKLAASSATKPMSGG